MDRRVLRVLTCVILSGTAGLIYQVAWVKSLGLIYGHTAYAIALVLAVFMGGLAAGSAFLGRWSENRGNLIRLYGQLEFLVGVTGALSIVGLAAVDSLFLSMNPALVERLPILFFDRFLGAAAVLFVPTFLMGGTFPILVSALSESYDDVPQRTSQIYWVNTAGATVGTLVAGFVLLPAVGLRLTIAIAAALNGVAGLLAVLLIDKEGSPPQPLPMKQPPSPWLLSLFAVMGAGAFAYEIAWTRLLAVTIGSSTYAFSLILAEFLAGTVIGSILFYRFVRRSPQRISLTLLSLMQTGIGALILLSLVLFHWTPALIPPLLRVTGHSFAGLLAAQAMTAALTVGPVAILFGINFPMVVSLIDRVGSAYAANTAGAIGGSLLTGFLFLPMIGAFRVIAGVAVLSVLLSLILCALASKRTVWRQVVDLVLILAIVVVAFSPFFYNQSLLALSAILYGSSYDGRLTLSEIAATKDLVFAAEGVNDSISVVRTDGDIALRVNGKVDASTQDSRTQLLLGHLGAALHPSPRRVLIIGFGSGMTVSAVARYPDVERIDCVEIEPAVIRAAPYLSSLNRNVLSDPRVHVIYSDARNFLLTSREHYDLIISEPSNPWIAGIATLFTDEYYKFARQRLAAGGMFVQWVQGYSLAPDDLRMIVASFVQHFPEVTLWRAGETDYLLLARTDVSALSFHHLRNLWQDAYLLEDFASLEIHKPEGLVAYFLLDDAALRQLSNGSSLNTDDRTLLEYHAPRSLLASSLVDVDQELIGRFRSRPIPSALTASDVATVVDAGLATALDLSDAVQARAFLALTDSRSHEFQRGRLSLIQGDLPNAKQSLASALEANPQSTEAAYWLAVAEHRNGDVDSATSRIDRILNLHPQFLPALDERLQLTLQRSDFQSALSTQIDRMALIPKPPAYEYGRLGGLWLNLSNFKEAEAALQKGLKLDPYCYTCHFELGELYLRTNHVSLARQNLEWAVRFFPDADPAAFRLLATIDLQMRDTKSADAVFEEGLRMFPDDPALQKAQADLKH